MRPLSALLLGMTAGCATADSGGGDPNGPCHGTAPVIDAFTVDEGTPIADSGGGDTQSAVVLRIDFSDPDGDAQVVSVDLWRDEQINGSVNIAGPADTTVADLALVGDDDELLVECAAVGGTVWVREGVTGEPLAFGMTYDFAVVLYDAAGLASEPAYATATTPAE